MLLASPAAVSPQQPALPLQMATQVHVPLHEVMMAEGEGEGEGEDEAAGEGETVPPWQSDSRVRLASARQQAARQAAASRRSEELAALLTRRGERGLLRQEPYSSMVPSKRWSPADWCELQRSVKTSHQQFDDELNEKLLNFGTGLPGRGPLTVRRRANADQHLLTYAHQLGIGLTRRELRSTNGDGLGKYCYVCDWADVTKYCAEHPSFVCRQQVVPARATLAGQQLYANAASSLALLQERGSDGVGYCFCVFMDKEKEAGGAGFMMAQAVSAHLPLAEQERPENWITVMVAETQSGESTQSNAEMEHAYFEALFEGLRERRTGTKVRVFERWTVAQQRLQVRLVRPGVHLLMEDDQQLAHHAAVTGCGARWALPLHATIPISCAGHCRCMQQYHSLYFQFTSDSLSFVLLLPQLTVLNQTRIGPQRRLQPHAPAPKARCDLTSRRPLRLLRRGCRIARWKCEWPKPPAATLVSSGRQEHRQRSMREP
jgi:hypothetical protein